METDPHMLLEGILIAGYATRTTVAYIYMRGEFIEQFHILQKAIDEAYEAGYFGENILGSGYDLDCYIHRGAGAYICGEETGLIESLEGKRGWPRIKPPFPAVEGAFRKPTVVNNVETLACLPHILTRGVDWWQSLGPEGSHGPKMYCVSGPVNKPGCYEGPLGITVRDLIYADEFGGGMRDGKKVKAVLPGGFSMGVLRGDMFPKAPDGTVDPAQDYDELDARLDFDDVRRYGLLGLGTAAAVVVAEDTDIRDVLLNVARFYAMESCGQCTQCPRRIDVDVQDDAAHSRRGGSHRRPGCAGRSDEKHGHDAGREHLRSVRRCRLADSYDRAEVPQGIRAAHRRPVARRTRRVDSARQSGGVRFADRAWSSGSDARRYVLPARQ